MYDEGTAEVLSLSAATVERSWASARARDRRARAILAISAMLGAINLSRGVSDPNLSREILQRTRDELISLNKSAKAHLALDASRAGVRHGS